MAFKLKFLLTLFILIVFTPFFLLQDRPALAFVSHIIRLKDTNGNPIVGASVFFASEEFDTNRICSDNPACEHDCGGGMYNPCCNFDCAYWHGMTWGANTDSHGIATFLGPPYADGSIQRCSTNYNNSLFMAIPYLNHSGNWRLDTISGYSGAAQKADSSDATELWSRLANNREHIYPDCQGHSQNPWFCEDGRYRSCGWSYQGFGSNSSNVAKIDTGESGGSCGHNCSGKPFNIYWEWTWVGPVAQGPNPEKQTVLGFVNNLFSSLNTIFKNLISS